MALNDPFFVVKEEVLGSLTSAKALFERWRDLLASPTIADADELAFVRKELTKVLRSIEWDLQDLDDTIQIVAKTPEKFKLEAGELDARRSFVQATRTSVQSIKSEVESPEADAKIRNTQRNALMPAGSGGRRGADKYARLDEEISKDNDEFIRNEQQRQQLIMRDQDQELDTLHEGVQRLGQIGQDIHVEITEQNRMFEELNDEMDHFEGRMDRVMKQINKILNNKDSGKMCVIVILFILLVTLGVLVFTV